MIKINLLSEGKRPAAVRKARVTGAPGRDIALWMMLLGALVGVLVAAGYWWYLRGKLEEKKQEVAQAQKQVDALQAVIREVEDFKRKKKSLTDKIGVINELKSNQRGPVRVMDYISRALPELLWLDRLKMSASNIEIEGRAFNPNAVANFMDNLDKVPEFREPVLRETSAQSNGVYKFFITFDYSFAPAKKPGEGKAPAAPVSSLGAASGAPPAGGQPVAPEPVNPQAPLTSPNVRGGVPAPGGRPPGAAPSTPSRASQPPPRPASPQ
jgi:type IV pilus assembly protein PilN